MRQYVGPMREETVSYQHGDDERNESPSERLDRNWNELLQGLRVTQTGIQILFAFLLILPFQARFDVLEGRQVHLYVVIVGLITASTFCVITPVLIHRMLFRRRAKDELVRATNKLTIVGLGLLGAALVCATALVVDVVLGRTAGYITAALCTVSLLGLWVVLPRILLRRSDGRYE